MWLSRRRVRDAAIGLSLGFAFTLAAIAAGDLRQSRSGEELGALDFFDYCVADHGDDSLAVLWESEVQGWRCIDRAPFVLHDIDVDAACTLLYEVPAVARIDGGTAYDWRCYRR